MNEVPVYTSDMLVDLCIKLEKDSKDKKRQLDNAKAELQARGLKEMEDRNVKYYKFFGESGSVAIADTMTLDTLNMKKLREALGEGLISEKVKETQEVKYKYDTKLERALKAIFTGDYTFEFSLREFLTDEMSVKPNEKQITLLLKKLKGDYAADKNTLISVLGYNEDFDDIPDFDVELYYIYKIKNAELIRAFLPEEGIDSTMDAVRKCIMVETKTSITLDYEKE